MPSFFRSKSVQVTVGAFAVLNMLHAGVIAQGAYRAYFASDEFGRNLVSISSHAPLETMLTRTGMVEASVHVNPDNVLDKPSAKFVINMNTLDTGIALRNEHMKSADWMDTAKYPTATFTLIRALPADPNKVIKLVPGAKDSMPVEGELELRGVKKMVKATVECEVIAATEQTKSRLEGDLLHIKATFPLKVSDFGLNIPDMAKLKVADVQDVSVDVFASTGSTAPKWVG